MKTAKQSFSKEPYNCLKPWDESTFCQCGGNGIVFTQGSMEEALKPENAPETVATVLGVNENPKKHYRTAFFEAFPKNPSCFIRGEGTTLEEAEAKAWAKWEKIKACTSHEWDRRNRTDGYVYCTKCPLSGSFLEPTTLCTVCQTPTRRNAAKDEETPVHYCIKHYLELPPEEVVFENTWGYSTEDQTYHFKEEQKVYEELTKVGYIVDEKSWEKFDNYFIRYRGFIDAKYAPLFGERLKSKQEVHEIIVATIPQMVTEILNKLKEDN